MVTFPMVLAVLHALPVCWADRHNPRKAEQLENMAHSIAEVANASKNPEDKAAKLVTLFRWESAGCIAVQDGSDHGPGRGAFQLEGQDDRYPGPFVGLSYEATLNQARVAGDFLDHSFQCGAAPSAVFTAYAGRSCGTQWKTLKERVSTYRWAIRRLRK